jgi:signal transduction histidine kinase
MTTVRHRAMFVRIASGLVLTGIYFITGKLGLRLAFVHPSATPIWAPSGISLAALLLFGAQAWPATFAGAFLVNITTTGSVATCLGIASGNTLEAIAGMWLINRFANGRHAFQTPQDTFKFAALAAGPSTMIAATFGATSLIVTGYASQADVGPIWVTWWLGDAIGDLLITPLLLVWTGDWKLSWRPQKAAEAGLLFVVLITGGLLVFGVGANREPNYPTEFLCLPILLWAAFRFGQREAISAAVVLAGLAIFGTVRGSGPFARASANTSLLLLQAYVGVITVTSIAVAAAILERQRVESKLRASQDRLLRSNADLEQFAYSASHDLQEPIRNVSLYAELLKQRTQGKIDSESDWFLDIIGKSAGRMAALVTDLLAYSRVTADIPLGDAEITDSAAALQKAIANLDGPIRENEARIDAGDLPKVGMSEVHLEQIFQNLISNAIKYRTDQSPCISVSARSQGTVGFHLFAVRDNGAGIEPEYHEKIFGLFKRLQRDSPGTGVGLAICKRAVERYGGRIWLESDLGKGSAFFFTVPTAEKRDISGSS